MENDDLISRRAAIACLGNSPEQTCMPWSEVERMLRELPSAKNTQVLHGQWIKNKQKWSRPYCSVCKCEALPEDWFLNPALMKFYETPHCPYCGAKLIDE